MFWIIYVYPRAAVVAAASLFAFAAILLAGETSALTATLAPSVGVGGVVLTILVAQWEARRRGGTGSEGSGPIEPLGPGSRG